ncbi:MAG: YbaB/EbfC family nucleoid-associated protein [bacterium]
MFNLGGFMEQIQKEFAALQRRLQSATYEGTAQGGKIRAWANGLQLLVALEISPDLGQVDITDDILKACNLALRQAREALNEELAQLTGGGIDFSSGENW